MPPYPLNIALKLAIFESRKKQQRIARLARIDITQLSHIVRGRREATPKQKIRLARVLNKSVEQLFGTPPATPTHTPPTTTETESAA